MSNSLNLLHLGTDIAALSPPEASVLSNVRDCLLSTSAANSTPRPQTAVMATDPAGYSPDTVTLMAEEFAPKDRDKVELWPYASSVTTNGRGA
jgi:hypothetical protein